MDASTFAWMVPLAFATFSGVFLALRLNGLGSTWWALAFACGAAAFSLSIFAAAPGALVKPLAEDALFIGAFVCLVGGLSRRTGRPVELRPAIGLGALSLLAAFGALALFDSVRLELVAVQTGICLILANAAAVLRGRVRHGPDRMLLALTGLAAASLLAQNAALLVFADPTLTLESWSTSIWAVILQAFGATIGLMLAVAVLLAIGRDIVDDLRRLSETDPLTGVFNRRGFEERVEAALAARGPGEPVTLLLADIDHFKRINDRFGHWAGDSVLCALVGLVQSILPEEASIGRMGGEEFAILMPGANLRTARRTAETIRTAFSRTVWPEPIGRERLTASFGVTDFGTRETLPYAIERADRLLYIAKDHGRDQVCTCSSGSTILPADPDGIGHPGGLKRRPPTTAAA